MHDCSPQQMVASSVGAPACIDVIVAKSDVENMPVIVDKQYAW
jgi:3'-phosphoadenosine 5'-phosphosulfate sulfotransferase